MGTPSSPLTDGTLYDYFFLIRRDLVLASLIAGIEMIAIPAAITINTNGPMLCDPLVITLFVFPTDLYFNLYTRLFL
jgi:hypothetical protein